MNFNQIEMRRETIFKDAVLSAAEAKSMEIIGEAQQQAARELAVAQASCEEADHDAIKAALAPDSEREHSTAQQQARRGLLQYRSGLVEGLFADVERQLARFAEGSGYKPWLLDKISKIAENTQKCDDIVVYIRKDDVDISDDLRKAAGAGATVAEDETIRLGGAKVRYGQVLYDATLDDALLAERECFEETSGMLL